MASSAKKNRDASFRSVPLALVDIVEYAKQSPATQCQWVQTLWYIAFTPKAVKKWPKGSVKFLSTGDGFYLVWWGDVPEGFQELYGYAHEVIELFRDAFEGDTRPELRILLHEGYVGEFQVHKNPRNSDEHRPEYGGPGMNDAARMVGFGTPGQLAFSKPFLDALRRFPPKGFPSVLPEHFTISDKHGIDHEIEILGDVSGRLGRHAFLRDLLSDELKGLAEEVRQRTSSRKESRNAVRASLFVPGHAENGEPCLTRTHFREVSPPIQWPVSYTKYPMDAEVGLAGVARTLDPQIVVYRDDPANDPKLYIQEIAANWGVPEDQVRRWRVKPRLLIGMPLQVVPYDEQPSAFLCIDANFTPSVSEAELKAMVIELMTGRLERIALLWEAISQ